MHREEDPNKLGGLPTGIQIYLSPSTNSVVLEFHLTEAPKEGEHIVLGVPADSALQLALALMACVRELRQPEMDEWFPPLKPNEGN